MSMASSSGSGRGIQCSGALGVPTCDVEEEPNEGSPKTGRGGVMMGLLESVSEARRSAPPPSKDFGKEPLVGVGTREDCAVAGVAEREKVSRKWAWVSMSRMGGGC
jgi:hypothetical protein